jgi:hypothetical protein
MIPETIMFPDDWLNVPCDAMQQTPPASKPRAAILATAPPPPLVALTANTTGDTTGNTTGALYPLLALLPVSEWDVLCRQREVWRSVLTGSPAYLPSSVLKSLLVGSGLYQLVPLAPAKCPTKRYTFSLVWVFFWLQSPVLLGLISGAFDFNLGYLWLQSRVLLASISDAFGFNV